MSKRIHFFWLMALWLGLASSLSAAQTADLKSDELRLNASIPDQWVSMADSVRIASAYYRRPIPGSKVTAAYVQIDNPTSQPVTLLSYHSPQVGKIELHESSMQNGMMRMRKIERHSIAAKSSLLMQAGGFHLMLFEPSAALLETDTILLTIEFADQTTREVELTAQALK